MTDEDVRTTFEGIVMHSIINYTSPPAPREVATPWYLHINGGWARDIYVSREGYARFFEINDTNEIENWYLREWAKLSDKCEALGLVHDGQYRITMIFYNFNPWQDMCNPHGIERISDEEIDRIDNHILDLEAEEARWEGFTTHQDISTEDFRDQSMLLGDLP
jgi:hypothetical protein